MHQRDEAPTTYAWIVYTVAVMFCGGLAGYILSATQGLPRTAAPAAPSAIAPETTMVDESALRAYRDILTRDPKNFAAAVKAGNLLYDAQRYHEAIGFYQQAMAQNASDINVSTDLGTALWYAGRADEALAQYEHSLSLDARHAQTLFNVGIVRADGKQDYAGAVLAWQTLLDRNPDYPAAARVQTMIADARGKLARR